MNNAEHPRKTHTKYIIGSNYLKTFFYDANMIEGDSLGTRRWAWSKIPTLLSFTMDGALQMVCSDFQ